MAVQEETFRIVTEASPRGIYAYKEAVEDLGREIYEFADEDLKRLDAMLEETARDYDLLTKNALEATAAQKKLGAATNEVAGGAGGGGGFKNLNIAVQQGAYAVGDFASTSGDLGSKLMSVSNNIQFVTAQMGPWGAAAGLAVVAGAALIKNWDALTRAMQEKQPFPEAADKLQEFNEKLERNKSRLEELRKQSDLTTREVQEYSKALADVARLETDIEAERQNRADRKKMEARPDVAEAAAAAERAGMLQESLGGRTDEAASELAQAMRESAAVRYSELLNQSMKATDPAEKAKILKEMELRSKQAGSTEANVENAKQMLQGAMERGDVEAFNQIRKYMTAIPDAFIEQFKLAFEQASPEAIAADAEFEQSLVERSDLVRRRGERRKEKEKAALGLAAVVGEAAEAVGDVAARSGQAQEQARKQAEQARKQAEQARKQAEAAADRQAREYAAGERGTGFQQRAALRSMQLQVQGMGPEAAQARTQAELARELRARDRGLSGEQAARVSGLIGKAAGTDLSRRSNALANQGLNLQQQAVMITQDLNTELGQMQIKLFHIDREQKRTRQEMQARRRAVGARGKD